jgi:hypothetical protein
LGRLLKEKREATPAIMIISTRYTNDITSLKQLGINLPESLSGTPMLRQPYLI